MFKILGQLRFSRSRGPAAQDRSGWWCRRRWGSGLLVTDNDVPGADFPFFDKTVYDIGIFAGEGFGVALICGTKNDQGSVGRVGERAGKNDFATFTSLVCKAQVFLAERSATGDKIIDNFVEQGVVIHRGTSFNGLAWSGVVERRKQGSMPTSGLTERKKNGRAEARPYRNRQNRRARIPYAFAALALTPL